MHGTGRVKISVQKLAILFKLSAIKAKLKLSVVFDGKAKKR